MNYTYKELRYLEVTYFLKNPHDKLKLVLGDRHRHTDLWLLLLAFTCSGLCALSAGTFTTSLLVVLVKPDAVALVHVVCAVMVEQSTAACFLDSLGRAKVGHRVCPFARGVELLIVFDVLRSAGRWDEDGFCSQSRLQVMFLKETISQQTAGHTATGRGEL
jgi:hypothetical protein